MSKAADHIRPPPDHGQPPVNDGDPQSSAGSGGVWAGSGSSLWSAVSGKGLDSGSWASRSGWGPTRACHVCSCQLMWQLTWRGGDYNPPA
ncbi:hypothetical protein Tco_1569797 [Tanacetum coccineum]